MTCPRCKTDAVPTWRFTKPAADGSQDMWLECSSCGYRGGIGSTQQQARESWAAGLSEASIADRDLPPAAGDLTGNPGPSVSGVFIETVAAYIKVHETSDISERYYRYTEMKDALRRVRFERRRTERGTAEQSAALRQHLAETHNQRLTVPIDQRASAAPVVGRVIEKPACPICSGKGYIETANSLSSGRTAEDLIQCPICKGTGLTESDLPFTTAQLERIAATPMHCTAEQYAAMAEKLAPFFNGPASWCPTCGKPLPMHGPYFMPCVKCPPEPRHILVIEELAAAVADRDLPSGQSRYAQWPEAEQRMYRDMATAVLNHLSPLRAAWFQAFGLIVCRNGSKVDQAKVTRFWVLMNQLTGLTRPEVPVP